MLILGLLFFLVSPFAFSKTLPPNFKVTNEMIYQKLIEIQQKQAVFEERFKQIDKHFEQIDKRFELINKRFEDMNKRFEDINKRFEDINRRFEDINDRFEQVINVLWMITGIFSVIMVATIGFAFWDRRTIINETKRRIYEDMDGELRPEKFVKVLRVLREAAKNNKEIATILRKEGLL
jgi:rubrerythrin